jgi:serine acetyltransferase
MDENETTRLMLLRLAGGLAISAYEGVLYFLSFLVPVLAISHLRQLHAAVLLTLAIPGFGIAGLTFLSLLVATKKFLIGPVRPTGTETIHTNHGKKWFLAASLTMILDNSPFRSMSNGLSLIASCYYRGMGAKMPGSVLLGGRTLIFDPWFLVVGENVNIGTGAIILGHLGHGKEIVLGRVVIDDGAIVGTGAIVFPDVHIGSNARVAAGAVVLQGTNIPSDETWAGIPARKVQGKRTEELSAA